MVEETVRVKRLKDRRDLAWLAADDVVKFGSLGELALVYDYPGLKPNERFFVSRGEETSPEGVLYVVYERLENLEVGDGFIDLRGLGTAEKTEDGLFHYGHNFVMEEPKSEADEGFVHPEKYREFVRALEGAGL